MGRTPESPHLGTVRGVRHPIRWLRAHPRGADAILTALVVVIGLVAHFTARYSTDADNRADPSVLGVVLVLAAGVPLFWRRRHPLPVLIVVTLAQAGIELLNAGSSGWMAILIAAYSLGAHQQGLRLAWVGGGFVAAVGAFVVLGAVRGDTEWGAVASTMLMLPASIVFGDGMRGRRKRLADLAERAERAERERELLAHQTLQDERTRIARELHDVVAHSVSVMVIQAGAARRQLSRNPEAANRALETIEATGREAMTEMRRILGVLRQEHDAAELAPSPSLDHLADLVRTDPDLPVVLLTEGDLDGIPGGIEVSVYRLVQEALTNVRRHAGRVDHVRVRLSRRDQQLEVEVTDDGRGASTLPGDGGRRPGGDGHGIVGMRERVTSAGGVLQAGPRPGGGWRVLATIPLDAVPSSVP